MFKGMGMLVGKLKETNLSVALARYLSETDGLIRA